MYQFDYIVVGSGLAGLYVAYHASQYGSVGLITKSTINESNSYFAQGGIAAVTDSNDAPALHFEDTIVAGRGLCDYPSVNILVNEGPERIKELIAGGMHFDMEDGSLALGLEGGHLRKRILHAGGDSTGRMVTTFMINKVLTRSNITIFEQQSALEVLEKDGCCYGIRTWDLAHHKENLFIGNHTFLTLGGTSAIYSRTTNPKTTIGDGIAIAYKAGCVVEDIEFIQFHPTALYTETGEAFLISEAVRGEGAYLLNSKGERFMQKVHELAELAPRDIVAQSIYREMVANNDKFVWLSLKHLNPEMIKHRFPTIYEKCKEYGYDMCDKIPVAPAAHYTVGGIHTDTEGRTNLKNLYVCGELASSGIMGANRLASNSLIECLVFGKRAVEIAKDSPITTTDGVIFKPKYTGNPGREQHYCELKDCVADIMTKYAGIIRNKASLEEGLSEIQLLRKSLSTDKFEYYTYISDNLLTVAELIIKSALYRQESRGGHYRTDFTATNDKFQCHILQQKNKSIETAPVVL